MTTVYRYLLGPLMVLSPNSDPPVRLLDRKGHRCTMLASVPVVDVAVIQFEDGVQFLVPRSAIGEESKTEGLGGK